MSDAGVSDGTQTVDCQDCGFHGEVTIYRALSPHNQQVRYWVCPDCEVDHDLR